MTSDNLVRKLDIRFDHTALTESLESIQSDYPFNDTCRLHLTHLSYVSDTNRRIYWGFKRSATGSLMDFQHFNPVFEDTVFHDVYLRLRQDFEVGMMILNMLPPFRSGGVHRDGGDIYVIPLTQADKGFLMFPEFNCCHYFEEPGCLYHFDSTQLHFAANTGKHPRVNLVLAMRPR